MKEPELVAALDDHDELILKCVRGELTFEEFDLKYNSFYHSKALDGQEANYAEIRILTKHASRIELHRRVWDEILIHVCTDEKAQLEEYRNSGRFGHTEAVERLRKLAEDAGILGDGSS